MTRKSLIQNGDSEGHTVGDNDKNTDACFRHQVNPAEGFCALCKAKRDGKNKIEPARKSFIQREKEKRS